MQLHIKAFDQLTADELYGLLKLRCEVFVVEQQCIYQDLDGRDQAALHVWLSDERGVVGCLRVLPAGLQGDTVAIGRVVVRDRGRGLGMQLLREGMKAAVSRLHADCIRLEAQCYAEHFYELAGFVRISEPFMEDGIPHVLMQWRPPLDTHDKGE